MEFSLLHTDPGSKARAGEITTAHGKIQTPIFMPVGTAATVKGVHQRDLKNEINPDIILGILTISIFARVPKYCNKRVGSINSWVGIALC